MSLFEPTVGAPERARVRVRLVVAYDGSAFRGFAANVGVRTVAGALGEALARVLGDPVELTCAGRTDAGVHAWGQVVTFDAAEGFDAARLQRSVNAMCGPDVAVRSVAVTAPGFDARFSARCRRYRYVVLNRPVPDPFLARTSWWVPEPLDLAGLRLACDPLVGEHDFSAFCRRPTRPAGDEEASLVRRVLDARWHDDGDGVLRFEIEASAFCHQMVRSIVGTLVAVGRRSMRAGEVAGVIRSRDRSRAGQLAPPHGLCLWSVAYDGWRS